MGKRLLKFRALPWLAWIVSPTTLLGWFVWLGGLILSALFGFYRLFENDPLWVRSLATCALALVVVGLGGQAGRYVVGEVQDRQQKAKDESFLRRDAEEYPEHFHPLPNWRVRVTRGLITMNDPPPVERLSFWAQSKDKEKRVVAECELLDTRRGRAYFADFEDRESAARVAAVYPDYFDNAPGVLPDGPYKVRFWGPLVGSKRVLVAEAAFQLRGGSPENL